MGFRKFCQLLAAVCTVSFVQCQRHAVYMGDSSSDRCAAGCVSPGSCPLGYFIRSIYTKEFFDYCCYVDDVAYWKQFDSDVAKLKMLDCRRRVLENFGHTHVTSDTKSVDLSFNLFQDKLPEIRDNFLKYLTQLKVLTISSSRVNDLPVDFLSTNTDLEHLYMTWNDLTEIPENVFRNNPNLVKIDFSGNQITRLPALLFKSTPKIEQVVLGNNNLLSLTSTTFRYLPNLRHLDVISNENLYCISSNVFRSNPLISYARFESTGRRIHRGMQKTYCSTCTYKMSHLKWGLKLNDRGRWQTAQYDSCREI